MYSDPWMGDAQYILFLLFFAVGGSLLFGIASSAGSSHPTIPYDHYEKKSRSRRTRKINRHALVHSTQSRTQKSSKLPLELVECIIDHLKDNPRALKACALTSRTWLPRARRHIHHALIVRKYGPDPYSLRFFPEAAECIRRVVIRDNLCGEVSNSTLVKLGLVDSLSLEATRPSACWEVTHSSLPSFPRLKELRLRDVFFRSSQDLFDVLRRSPGLTTLSIDFTRRWTVRPPVRESYVSQFSLEVLNLRISPIMVDMAADGVPNALLHAAGSSLKHLSVDIIPSDYSHAGPRAAFTVLDSLDFSYTTSLQSLSVSFEWSSRHEPWASTSNADLFLVNALVSQISSPSLRTIAFRIFLPSKRESPRWLRYFDIRLLDGFAELSQEMELPHDFMERTFTPSKNLTSFTVELVFPNAFEEANFPFVEQLIKSQLPSLYSREILHIRKVRS